MRRLTGVDLHLRHLAADTTRITALLGIAVLLILVLLPAAVRANGH